MTSSTQKVLLIGGGVAVAGILIYMIFAPKGQSSTLSYTSGNINTTPYRNNPALQSEIQAGASIVNNLIDKFFSKAPAAPATDQIVY